MRPLSLNRVLERAVQYALLSTLVACGGRSFESDGSQQRSNLDDPEDEVGPGDTPQTSGPTPTGTPMEPGDRVPVGQEPQTPEAPVANEPSTPAPTAPRPNPVATQEPAPTPTQGPTEPAPNPVPTQPGDLPASGYETLACNAEQAWDLEAFSLTGEYDYVAVRAVPPFGERTELASSGEACSGAADSEACQAAVAEAWPTTSEWLYCGQAGCEYKAIVTTRGDEVELHTERAALHALLGSIESMDEAVIWLQMNGHQIQCEAAEARLDGAAYQVKYLAMISDCPVQHAELQLEVSPDGTITEFARAEQPQTEICVGRRPEGLDTLRASNTGRLVGDFFAEVAQLEEAAVEAFRVIADELAALGAPEHLRRAALEAREDEVRHTVESGHLARRYGVEPLRPVISERPLRTRFEFARDNVVEGCVRETFGAAFAKHQAVTARDPEVRRTMASIAADETRHAELSWALHAWIIETLDATEIRELERVRREAIDGLRGELDVAVSPELCVFGGVPDRARALALLDALEAQLWSESAPLAA